MTEVASDDAVMQEEIFGPILPILTVDTLQEAITFVQDREKPLALYVFSKRQKVVDEVLARTSSGGACVNDAVIHISGKKEISLNITIKPIYIIASVRMLL